MLLNLPCKYPCGSNWKNKAGGIGEGGAMGQVFCVNLSDLSFMRTVRWWIQTFEL